MLLPFARVRNTLSAAVPMIYKFTEPSAASAAHHADGKNGASPAKADDPCFLLSMPVLTSCPMYMARLSAV